MALVQVGYTRSIEEEATKWADQLVAKHGERASTIAASMLGVAKGGRIPDHIAMCERLVELLDASTRSIEGGRVEVCCRNPGT